MKNAIVIGAGIGGIAIAARLAKAGYKVNVYEKTGLAGGRACKIERDGFFFDTGPSLFLMPATFSQTYADLGERMADHLDLVRIDPTYRVHFHDGSRLDLGSDMNALRDQLEGFEPGSFQALLRFLEQGYAHFNLSLERFVGRNFAGFFDFFNLSNLPLLFQLKALQRHYAHTSRFFEDPRLRAALSFQNMYLGLSPYDAPATYTLLQYTEIVDGVWYPRHGMYDIVTSLCHIAEGLGVTFHYDAPVKQIDVDGDRTTGVTLESGETYRADVVVANADLPYVYTDLLPDPAGKARSKMDRFQYTSSTLMFYWGLDNGPEGREPALLHHNVFLADHEYESSFRKIFKEQSLPAEPSFYIHVPSRSVPELAPPDKDAWMVLVPTGHLSNDRPQDWPALQDQARDWVFQRLSQMGVTGVRERIVFEETLTPPSYKEVWNLAKGATFGLAHNVLQVGYLRPQNRHSRYKNLYFAGASTHPGTGVPIVLLCAKLVEERIRNEQPAPV